MAKKKPSHRGKLRLTRARPRDAALILSLIKELGKFEKLSHEIVNTPAMIRKYLFGRRPYANVVLAHLDGEPAGFALYFHNYSTFVGRPGIYLEDLFVKPEFRGLGIGERLLQYIAREAVRKKCGRLEWAVLNWNERAIKFYRRLGSRPMTEWTVHRLAGPALKKLAKT